MRHRWSRVGIAAAIAAMTATGITAVGDGVAGAKAKPFRILMFYGPTTPFTATNAQTAALLGNAGVTVVNKTGGAGGGHKVQLTLVNTNTKPTTTVSDLQAALHSSTPPNVVLFANASAESAAGIPLTSQAKVLSFNQAPTPTSETPSKSPYNFDIAPTTASEVLGFAAEAKAKGYTKIAIFHGNDAYGTSVGKAMTAGAKTAGLTVTDNVGFSYTALTFTATLQAIEATHPQALWLDGYGAVTGYTMKGVAQLNWTIPMMADDSYSVSPPVVAAPPTGNLGTTEEKNLEIEVVAASVYAPPAQTPKNITNMISAMKRNGSPKSSLLFGYQYDAVLMATYAARLAKTTTTASKLEKEVIKEEGKKGTVPTGLFATYGYSAASHGSVVPASGWTFIKPGPLTTGLYNAPSS